MSAAPLSRQDTTKGPPLRILSLDGGGVRGYSIFILLQELMHRTHVEMYGQAPRPHEIPKPCDHFDLIAGTGTGGLIAIMLGRLRLDLETCKTVYTRMTRKVFETDKTIAGIPYKSTLFKASMLEDAICECVREHTINEEEGNDILANLTPMTPDTPHSTTFDRSNAVPSRSRSVASRRSIGDNAAPFSPAMSTRSSAGGKRWGNPEALLHDVREHRTKTAVTAVYKGARAGDKAVLLRSYDSRREPPPEINCTIWQAGRATCATGLAFKPIQIGQSVFIDEGAGRFNPSPQILDEAVLSEYPSRDVGVFVSIGTGKRPSGTANQESEWWEGFLGSTAGAYAEARRRLIAKIEGCEQTHQFMLREHLPGRHVPTENYYRLNVEVGVGEFGMNEWTRLADISTNTRRYLAKEDVKSMTYSAANKLARIHRAKSRWERSNGISPPDSLRYSFEEPRPSVGQPWQPPSHPGAVELPADVPPDFGQSSPYPPTQIGFAQQQAPYPDSPEQQYASLPTQTPPQQQQQQPQQNPYPANPQFRQQYHRPSYDDKIVVAQEDPSILPDHSNPNLNFDADKVDNPDAILPQNYAPLPSREHQGPIYNSTPPSSAPHNTNNGPDRRCTSGGSGTSPPRSHGQAPTSTPHQRPNQYPEYPTQRLQQTYTNSSPPPLPPKTPIPTHNGAYLQRPPVPYRPSSSSSSYRSRDPSPNPTVDGQYPPQQQQYQQQQPPPPMPPRNQHQYQDPSGPPPVVNMGNKPSGLPMRFR